MVEAPIPAFHPMLLRYLWQTSTMAPCPAHWTHCLVPHFFGAPGRGGRCIASTSLSFARTSSNTRQIHAACALPPAERFRLISLRLQMIPEDWTAVMCNLCQSARAVRPNAPWLRSFSAEAFESKSCDKFGDDLPENAKSACRTHLAL